MSSNARDSRGASVNVTSGAVPGHAPRKHRYTAVTETGSISYAELARLSDRVRDHLLHINAAPCFSDT